MTRWLVLAAAVLTAIGSNYLLVAGYMLWWPWTGYAGWGP
jgi:hypothetical protein